MVNGAEMMNPEQLAAFEVARSGHSLLLTGQCGTGKSFVVRKIAEALTAAGKSVAVTAASGVAGTNFKDATTLHAWTGIRDRRLTKKQLVTEVRSKDGFLSVLKRIREADVLIIDEIGMISKGILEDAEYVCRKLRGCDFVFGGLQVVASGDFKQLAPVPNMLVDDDGSYCVTSSIFNDIFPHKINLTTVVRQTDEKLITAVNELCDGNPSPATDELMVELRRPLPEGVQPVKLFGTRFEVDYHNMSALEEMTGELALYRAEDTGEKHLLNKCRAPKLLYLKIGAPVIVTRNIAAGGLHNGAQGIVHSLGKDGPKINVNGKLVDIHRERHDFFDRREGHVRATRWQFPLILSFAVTVHRAQGLTIPSVEIDCSQFFAAGQLGVAVGRCVSKSGLRVVNYDPRVANLKHQKEVYHFYEDLLSKEVDSNGTCCRHFSVKGTEEEVEDEMSASSSSASALTTPTAWTPPERPTTVAAEFQQCPYEIEKFIESIQGSPIYDFAVSVVAERKEEVSDFASRCHSKSLEFLKGTMRRPGDFNTAYEKLNAFMGSDYFQSMSTKIIPPVDTKKGTKLAAKLALWCWHQLIKDRAERVVVKEGDIDAAIEVKAVSGEAREKIRYIGGASVWRVTQRLKGSIANVRPHQRDSQIRHLTFLKCKMLDCLRITEAEAIESEDVDSLQYINFKQNASRGLFHMSDNLFAFFCQLHCQLFPYLCRKAMDKHGKNIHSTIENRILADENILAAWFRAFSALDLPIQVTELEDDIITSMQLDLFEGIARHYIRVCLFDAAKIVKEEIPRKKKVALRTKLAALSQGSGNNGEQKRKLKVQEKAETKSHDVDPCAYACPVCHKPCEDEEGSENSIACDSCNKWCHWSCVNITGTERFLSNQNSIWTCPLCKDARNQRREMGGKRKRKT